MNIIWAGLVIYAVVEAIAAAGRVRQKRQQANVAGFSRHGLDLQPLQLPTASPEAIGGLETGHESNRLSTNRAAKQAERSAAPAIPNLLVEPELLQPPELQAAAALDLPLAVSVSVTDLAQAEPPVTTSTIELDLVPPELALPEMESVKADRQPQPSAHQSILAEITELGRASTDAGTETGTETGTDAITHFQRYLDHPDDIVRSATVFELGELAAKRQGAEAAKILGLLTPLSQDPDPEVRSQVLVALAKIQSIIS